MTTLLRTQDGLLVRDRCIPPGTSGTIAVTGAKLPGLEIEQAIIAAGVEDRRGRPAPSSAPRLNTATRIAHPRNPDSVYS